MLGIGAHDPGAQPDGGGRFNFNRSRGALEDLESIQGGIDLVDDRRCPTGAHDHGHFFLGQLGSHFLGVHGRQSGRNDFVLGVQLNKEGKGLLGCRRIESRPFHVRREVIGAGTPEKRTKSH